MPSFETKMWWAVMFTGLILLGLAVAAKKQNWGWATWLSGFLLAGLFAVMMECMWWLAE